MFCTSCGKEIKEGKPFCPFCGTPTGKKEADTIGTSSGFAGFSEMPELEPSSKMDSVATSAPVAPMPTPTPVAPIPAPTPVEPISTPTPVAPIPTPVPAASIPPATPTMKPSGDRKKVNVKLLAVLAVLVVLILALAGEAVYLIKSHNTESAADDGSTSTSSGSSGGLFKSSKNNIFSINVYDANDPDTMLTGAKVTIFDAEKGTSGESIAEVTYSSDDACYVAKGLTDGNYLLVYTEDGYARWEEQVAVTNDGKTKAYMTKLPEAGAMALRVDWKGDQDVDICIFNADVNDYISIGNPSDNLGNYITRDNGSDKGYEVVYLPSAGADVVRTIYVVDSGAAADDSTSAMEADGLSITAYDSSGEILHSDADPTQDAPIWNPGYVYSGKIYTDTTGFMGECADANIWSQFLKAGQSERIKAKIVSLNTTSNAIPVFDSSANRFSPSTRDSSRYWDKTVFYALEEHLASSVYFDKNVCPLKKLQVRSSITGNLVDYDAYLNPNTMLPNKIVSIEYLSNGIEVYEYYYDNNGKVSFIFVYTTDNYVSTYATVDKVGQRFLFSNDTLTTWRIVRGAGNIDNFCCGRQEEERLKDGSWNKNSIKRYDTFSTDLKNQYDNMEKKMINYAYNTYEMVMNTETVGQIVGVVYDGNYNPYPNSKVELYDKNFDTLLYTATPNSSGEYCIYIPNDVYSYNIKVVSNSYNEECDIYDIDMDGNTLAIYVDSAYFFDNNTSEQTVSLYIGNAFYGHGSSVCDADIYVRRGINNRYGEVILQTRTNSDGYVELRLAAGVYTVEASKSGYESIYYTIVANPYQNNWYEYYTPPTLSNGEYAIVLSWGEYPYDLDSHLFTSTSGGNQHVWYADKYDSLDSYLDVDDTSSYGPETVTIRRFDPGKYYKYCVIDYTNSSRGYYSSSDMSYSNATVTVYSGGGHVATYHVPVNRNGVVWEVFEIRNGILTPIQRYYDNMDDFSWWNH